jgi:putative transcriptional regulator
MPIIVNLDVMLARRKMRLNELSEHVGITMANLSNLKTGKARAIRFTTLEAICAALDCQPGDLIEYRPAEDPPARGDTPDPARLPPAHRPQERSESGPHGSQPAVGDTP